MTLRRVPIPELFAEADIVAVIQIVDGKVIPEAEGGCGAKYTAKVLDPLKNTMKNQAITIRGGYGYKLGHEYLVFLKKYATPPEIEMYNAMAMPNADPKERVLVEALAKCISAVNGFSVLHAGTASLSMGRTEFARGTGAQEAVLIPTRFISVDKSIISTPVKGDDADSISEPAWVEKAAFLQYLRGLDTKFKK